MKNRLDDEALVRLAVRLAGAGAGEILKVQAAGFTVARKADQSPVTLADQRAERIIVDGLRAAAPYIPVIAEEELAGGKIIDPGAEYWLVDPLDGTREFAAGRAEFAVNIGLIRNRRAVLGAVADPSAGEIFFGVRGVGAWKQSAAGVVAIAARRAPAAGLSVMASRHYRDDPALARLLADYKIASLANMGSALKFLRLAEGLADFYPRLGRTMEWDTAAPQAVLEAAGGAVLTFDGEPLCYGKAGFENPPFLCHGLR